MQHTEIYLLSYFYPFSTFMNHVRLKRNSRFMPRKKGQSHPYALQYFHAIKSIILLFNESRPEKSPNHDITTNAWGASTYSTSLIFCNSYKRKSNYFKSTFTDWEHVRTCFTYWEHFLRHNLRITFAFQNLNAFLQ